MMFGSHLKSLVGFAVLFICLLTVGFSQNTPSQVVDTKAEESDKAKNLVVNVELVKIATSDL